MVFVDNEFFDSLVVGKPEAVELLGVEDDGLFDKKFLVVPRIEGRAMDVGGDFGCGADDDFFLI